jgi:hypothetical protein
MADIHVEEWQLLSFFEASPDLRDADVPWCYNDALYCVKQGDVELSFAIDPAYRDVRIALSHRGETLYELNAMRVDDVRYRNENQVETLEVVLNDRASLVLRVRPRIELVQRLMDREA